MQIRLHDRSEGDGRPQGLSCDEDGLGFGGDHALIEASDGPFGRIFCRRPIDQINRLLSAGYGAPIDLAEREPLLDRIADCLTKGDLAQAQLLALHLRLPDLPDEQAADRLAKAEQLLRYNHHHDDQGRFASAPGDGAGGGTPILARDPTPQVQAAAARALQARNLGPIQGEYVDPNLNALNYLANGKPVPAGLPTPKLDQFLKPAVASPSSRPEDLFGAVTLDAADRKLATFLDSYLNRKGPPTPPLAGYGSRLVYWGKTFNIDPRLLVALAGAESGFGAHVTMGANNYWNWETNQKHPSQSAISSVDHAIQLVSSGLDRLFDLSNLGFYDGTKKAQGNDARYYCASGCSGASAFYRIFHELGGEPTRLGYGATSRPYVPPSKEERR